MPTSHHHNECDSCGTPFQSADPAARLCGQCGGHPSSADADLTQQTRQGADPTIDSGPRHAVGSSGEVADETIDSGVVVPNSQPQDASSRRKSIGRFQIRRALGFGAFGKVYLAHDPLLDREVALKVPRFPPDEPDLVERFLREAKTAARLRHPNIVTTFECGRVDHDYYIATEFVDGMPLSKKIIAGGFDQRQAAIWIRDLADALTYAHGEEIIHRDIKPANIMLSHAGRPELMDFGLAKIQTDDDSMTIDGSVVGTPAYMAPEQARGEIKATGPKSDQYSLGAVFYELLTGQKPFSGSMHSIIMRVSGDEHPQPIRNLRPTVSPDLEAICEKALSKHANDRYPGTAEFALDIERWLNGEPILARRISQLERMWRWCRRNRAVASLLFLVASMLLIGAAVSAVAALNFRTLANKERETAELARDNEIAAQQYARDAELRLADMFTFTGLAAAREGDPAQAVLWFAHAIERSHDDSIRVEANRVRFNSWSRQSPRVVQVLHPGQFIKQMDFDPSGRYLLTRWYYEPLHLWDVAEGRSVESADLGENVTAAVWSPDGRWLAEGLTNGIQFNQVGDWAKVSHHPLPGPVQSLAFSPDVQWLAVGFADGDQHFVRLWNCVDGEFSAGMIAAPAATAGLAFAADSDQLAVSCSDGSALVFRVPLTGGVAEPQFAPLPNIGPDDPITPIFVQGDSVLLTLPQQRTRQLRWSSTTDGEPIADFSLSREESRSGLNLFAVSPGRRFMLLCSPHGSAAWDVSTQSRVGKMMPHTNIMSSVAFHKEGDVLLTGSLDRTARLWEFPSGTPLGPSINHEAEVHAVAYSPEISTFATCQGDGVVKIWRLTAKSSRTVQRENDWPDAFLSRSDDGRYVAPANWNAQRGARSVNVIDTTTGKDAARSRQAAGILNAAALSADGSKVMALCSKLTDPEQANAANRTDVMSSEPGWIELWERASGAELIEPIETPTEPIAGAWHPTRPLAAVLCAGGQLLFVDTELGQIRHTVMNAGTYRTRFLIRGYLRFTDDGANLVSWGLSPDVRVWDVAKLQERFSIQTTFWATDVIFSRDSKLMVVCGANEFVRIVDMSTGADATPPLVHRDWVFTASFSQDESLLITAGRDKTARVWNWRSGSIAAADLQHRDEVFDADFVKGTNWVVTTSRDGSVRFWDLQSGQLLAPPLHLDKVAYSVIVNPESQTALISGSNSIHVLNLQSLLDDRSPTAETRLLQAELISGRRLLPQGGVANLESSEWETRWRAWQASAALEQPVEFEIPESQ